MKFHISRWHYWWGYFLIVALIVISIWILFGGSLKWFVLLSFFSAALLALFEFLIRLERVTITEHGIEFCKGIFSRRVMRASYHTISNVFVHQSLVQRILRYGNVEIDTAGGPEPEIVLHNFQKAGKIEEMIESHSRKARQAQAYAPKK